MKHTLKIQISELFLLLGIALLMSTSIVKADVWDNLPSHRDEYKENEGVEEFVWKEDGYNMPDYPDNGDLLEIAGPPRYKQYQYLIDSKNLKVGEDGVVRYSIVIRSTSGADNVMYEGLRCTTEQVKSYAYGSTGMDGKKQFIARLESKWKPLSSTGVTGYTQSLRVNYFCSLEGFPLSKPEILQNIKYGKGPVDGTYN